MIAGFDEAGRGSLIGPLVASLVVFSEGVKKKKFYKELNDSKKLSKKKREALFEEIKKNAKFYYKKIMPSEIDSRSINELEKEALKELLKRARKESKIKKLYVDLFAKSKRALGINEKGMQLIAEHKADSKYKVVSAASIVSKVIRDREIEKIRKKCDIGSGYPSDKKTIEGVMKCGEKIKKHIRKKWKTMKNIEKKSREKSQKKLTEF